jgi:serine/threonine protein phosphatase PrpC
LANDVSATEGLDTISRIKNDIVNAWEGLLMQKRISNAALTFPNGMVGRPYCFRLDASMDPYSNMDIVEIQSSETDISYDRSSGNLTAMFSSPGECTLTLLYKLQPKFKDQNVYTRDVKITVNPDPRTLWKNIDSDRQDKYWKQDEASFSTIVGDWSLVIGSKRGRSHAHDGKFRDDDFAFRTLNASGWNVLVVADGAGSAQYGRAGSSIACRSVIEYYSTIDNSLLDQISSEIEKEIALPAAETQRTISAFCVEHMGRAAFSALSAIREEANKLQSEVREYATTLLVALTRQFDDKLFVSSFWVGDGCIALFSEDSDALTVLGSPDSGEYSGQTRFLTMPEIFANNAYVERVKYKIVGDYSSLFLMTDGVTDAKFENDAALGNLYAWHAFANDLNGNNPESTAVLLFNDSKVAEDSLLSWLDYWSPGNHDDRTIAILYKQVPLDR